MKNSAIALVASAALAYGQGYTFDEATGKYTCSKPNVAFCVGDSMQTDIILRCMGTVGQPGRCGDVSISPSDLVYCW